ncbi:hypothetical protein MT378_02060 [Psychrobacter sp. 16-Bac2893]
MKMLNQLVLFLSGVIVLTACSSEVANADIDVAQAEADVTAAQNKVINSAQLELPFIGERFFDFVGANATMQGIKIDSKGYTTIEGQAGGLPYVIYEGKYSQMMPGFDGEIHYAVIGKNAIAELDSEGNLKYGEGCNIDDGEPCISDFIPEDEL